MPAMSIATGESRPLFESNNVVWNGGGGGANLVTTSPTFVSTTPGAANDWALAPGSVGIDGALVNAETPTDDFDGRPRGDKPDIGAHELGADAPACP